MALRRKNRAINVRSLEQIDGFVAEGKPVLIDFMQFGCAACKAMDGTIDDIADEFAGSAYVLKVNVAKVPGAAAKYRIKGTPTFVLFGNSERAKRKAKRRGEDSDDKITQRFRTSGVVPKPQLRRLLLNNGAAERER